MWKVRQNDFQKSEKIHFFCYGMFRYFFVNLPSIFVIQEWLDPLSSKRKDICSFLEKFRKWPQSCRKSKMFQILTFSATSRNWSL